MVDTGGAQRDTFRVKAAVKKRYDAKKRGDAQWSQAEQ